MTALKAELIEYINKIPDENLASIKSLISSLSHDTEAVGKAAPDALSAAGNQDLLSDTHNDQIR
ncbi:MAG: hypothetical protein LBQ15_11780 [Clostridium sp.]|jgi:hypothetical protein|nr:hypothetical protein [Clostridium sp.]